MTCSSVCLDKRLDDRHLCQWFNRSWNASILFITIDCLRSRQSFSVSESLVVDWSSRWERSLPTIASRLVLSHAQSRSSSCTLSHSSSCHWSRSSTERTDLLRVITFHSTLVHSSVYQWNITRSNRFWSNRRECIDRAARANTRSWWTDAVSHRGNPALIFRFESNRLANSGEEQSSVWYSHCKWMIETRPFELVVERIISVSSRMFETSDKRVHQDMPISFSFV